MYDRYPVAYAVSSRNDNSLVWKTFDKATATFPDDRPIFHSDRGFQYTGRVFQKKLEKQKMKQSMSRVGHGMDNGPTEGFWGIIKSEIPDVRDNGQGFIKICHQRLPAFLQ